MKLIDAIIDTVYTHNCPICDKVVISEKFCDRCINKIEFIKEETCFKCGLNVKACDCNIHVYHFDGVVAPYYNEDFAQIMVYRFKFNKRFTCVPILGDIMADLAANKFGIENIDLITFVPMALVPFRVRGFNQSELLAERISEKLSIKLDRDVLKKRNKVKTQHDIKSLGERFKNVRNAFYYTKNIKGKNVLLVDDIKTSGATLDECARQLKFAGANMVYCVTALISNHNKNG